MTGMELGFVGLGKMGLNMVRRLRGGGHAIVAFDRNGDAVKEAEKEGATAAASLDELVDRLKAPRVVWVMVPAGPATEEVVGALVSLLEDGDVIVDGGNSNYKDTIRRHDEAAKAGVRLLDAGTSGGVWGLKNGYCLMVGGEKDAYDAVTPVLKTLAPENGLLYCGPSGSGHYVKMIHNGIEYGMLQAYAEGFEILNASRYDLDLAAISKLWNHGSVVRSWLLELCENVFAKDASLESVDDAVADSGEGRWTIQEAMELDVPAPVLTLSLLTRFRSRQDTSFGGKVIAALRNEFGGHAFGKASGR
ncbi:MAG: decarboxylating 6-phosphogluconate dehydrogenase [Deltaproteobacteria bacterium]|nr:decarboxylating 6-phosphogluconate dehydrogenase [Deltaproteobacteria bacterium]